MFGSFRRVRVQWLVVKTLDFGERNISGNDAGDDSVTCDVESSDTAVQEPILYGSRQGKDKRREKMRLAY